MMRHAFASMLLVLASGCYTYVPVEVAVMNAATERPVPGVEVQVYYRRFVEFFPPRQDRPVTGPAGRAVLRVCDNYRWKLGDVFEIGLAGEPSYLLDQPSPATVIEVPLDRLRAKAGGMPRVDVRVVTIAEHRRRYAPPATGPAQ
jgi:hypothetical protein